MKDAQACFLMQGWCVFCNCFFRNLVEATAHCCKHWTDYGMPAPEFQKHYDQYVHGHTPQRWFQSQGPTLTVLLQCFLLRFRAFLFNGNGGQFAGDPRDLEACDVSRRSFSDEKNEGGSGRGCKEEAKETEKRWSTDRSRSRQRPVGTQAVHPCSQTRRSVESNLHGNGVHPSPRPGSRQLDGTAYEHQQGLTRKHNKDPTLETGLGSAHDGYAFAENTGHGQFSSEQRMLSTSCQRGHPYRQGHSTLLDLVCKESDASAFQPEAFAHAGRVDQGSGNSPSLSGGRRHLEVSCVETDNRGRSSTGNSLGALDVAGRNHLKQLSYHSIWQLIATRIRPAALKRSGLAEQIASSSRGQ